MRKLFTIILSVILAVSASVTALSAQTTGNYLTVSSFVGDVEMKIGDGDWTKVAVDTQVPENAMIRVNSANGSVVLSMSDGSEVKLFGMTSVQVGEVMRSAEGRQRSFFQLLAGKIFAAVTHTDTQDFRVETGSAVAAVRGTKFGMSYNGTGGDLTVIDGLVELSDPHGTSAPASVGAGQSSAFSRTGGIARPAPASPQLLAQYEQTAATTTTTVASTTTTTVARTSNNFGVPDTTTQTTVGSTTTTTVAGSSGSSGTGSDECSSSGFNWSVSSEMIDGTLWNKVLLAPTFKLGDGKFVISLYLPVYFQNLEDLVAPIKWYNYWQDWNFGTGGTQFEWTDMLHDLFMKIRYFSIKSDKLFFQLGNIPSMTLGHGILVSDYANDTQFPEVRKLGIQYNMDLGGFGFEMMSGDVFMTKLFATRLFVRPLHKAKVLKNAALGISGFVDLDPLGQAYNDVCVFGYAADLDLPIIKMGEVFNMTFFFDIATLGYGSTLKSTDAQGFGYETGVLGKVIGIDYRAAFKSVQNGFVDNYVDRFYDSSRDSKFLQLYTYDASVTPNYNGFVIGAGKNFEKVGGINLSFEQLFPAGLEDMGLSVTDVAPNNFLHIELAVDKCLFKKAYGKIAYDRENFYAKDFFSGFFGEGAIISASIYYQVAAPSAYIGISYKRYYKSDGTTDDTFGFETTLGL